MNRFFFGQSPPPRKDFPGDQPPPLPEGALDRLAELLTINDTGTEDAFAEVKDALFARTPGETAELEKRIHNFDFKGALESLNKISHILGKTPEKGPHRD